MYNLKFIRDVWFEFHKRRVLFGILNRRVVWNSEETRELNFIRDAWSESHKRCVKWISSGMESPVCHVQWVICWLLRVVSCLDCVCICNAYTPRVYCTLNKRHYTPCTMSIWLTFARDMWMECVCICNACALIVYTVRYINSSMPHVQWVYPMCNEFAPDFCERYHRWNAYANATPILVLYTT